MLDEATGKPRNVMNEILDARPMPAAPSPAPYFDPIVARYCKQI